MGAAIGIDFGITSARMAVLEREGPRVLDVDDEDSIPAVAGLDPHGQLVVGYPAVNAVEAIGT